MRLFHRDILLEKFVIPDRVRDGNAKQTQKAVLDSILYYCDTNDSSIKTDSQKGIF